MAVVGQNPGPTEAETGIPFSGKSGQFLNSGMWEVGIKRDTDVFVSNIVKCYIAPGKPVPHKAIECCKPLLYRELECLPNLRVTCTMGLEAFNILTKKDLKLIHHRKASVKNPRYWVIGYPFRTQTTESKVIIPFEHPASVARGGYINKPLWQAHWRKAKRWFDGKGAVYKEEVISDPTEDQVKAIVKEILERKLFGCDIETPFTALSEDNMAARAKVPIDEIGLSVEIGKCTQVKPHHFHLLAPLFVPGQGLTGFAFNYGFEWFHMTHQLQQDLSTIRWYDFMLALNLLYSDFRTKDLGMALSVWTDIPFHKNLQNTKPDIYNARDTYGALWGGMESWEDLKAYGSEDVFWNNEMPVIPVCEDLKNIGTKCDVTYAKRAELTCYKQLDIYDQWWSKNIPGILWTSAQQLQVLFDKMRMPPRFEMKKDSKTKKKTRVRTVNAKALEEYRDVYGNKTAGLLLEMRRLKKAADFTHIHSEDGRAHAVYKIHGQKQGRIQAEDPDLQNIPEEAAGTHPRRIITGDNPDTDVVIVADFSQIELRIYVQQAGDVPWQLAFERGDYVYGDIYEEINPGEIFFIPGKPRTKDNRDDRADFRKLLIAKSCPLGFIYGRGPGSMVDLGVTAQKGREIFNRLDREHTAIGVFHKRLMYQAYNDGYIRNAFGRIRRFPNPSMQRNEILSCPGQSNAADVLRVNALIPFHQGLKPYGARTIFTVHDSTGVSCPKSAVVDCVNYMVATMEAPIPQLEGLSIPVEIKIGPNWNDVILYDKWCKQEGISGS